MNGEERSVDRRELLAPYERPYRAQLDATAAARTRQAQIEAGATLAAERAATTAALRRLTGQRRRRR